MGSRNYAAGRQEQRRRGRHKALFMGAQKAKFTEGNSTPCPRCQWPIAVHYDAPDCVGPELAGYYLSHAPWTPYPKWTDCGLYERVRKMPKFDTSDEANAARAALKA